MTFRDGDYIVIRGIDFSDERESAFGQLLAQGCKSVRFATLADGRLQAHGYLRQMECEKCGQPAKRFEGMWCEACNG